ncbi:MAG: rhomboid family intramembrane serine protease [Candidatus Heimdallarchaeota archaeon]|nr:rhomboid family intramembrane serine protease [Candidatus Heimdallarchaeota archaeon]MCK4878355.1 rhomboid family intramembrane serine protease [Candidatus Heimdallarchaeota archaeon]
MSQESESSYFESFWKTNLPTRNLFILIAVCYVIISIISIVRGEINDLIDVFTISDEVLVRVGQFNLLVLNGHVYQLLTSIFVHVDILHFLSNCLFLLIFGLRAEEKLLSWQYYVIFLVSGLMGGLLSLAVFDPLTISAGASGGVFGLLGVDIVLAFEEDKRRSFWSYSGVGVIFLIITGGMNVNFLAHAIGLVTGILLPLFVLKKRKKKELPSENLLE